MPPARDDGAFDSQDVCCVFLLLRETVALSSSFSGPSEGHTFARWLASMRRTGREQRTDVSLSRAKELTPCPRSQQSAHAQTNQACTLGAGEGEGSSPIMCPQSQPELGRAKVGCVCVSVSGGPQVEWGAWGQGELT